MSLAAEYDGVCNDSTVRSIRQKGYVTTRSLGSVRLVAVLLIVVGLAISVPPSVGSSDGEHFGLLLHPLFPHVHGSPASVLASEDDTYLRDGQASSDLRQADDSPGIRSQAPEDGFRSALSGIVLPVFLAGVFLQLRPLTSAGLRVAHQHWHAPPLPPPRSRTPLAVM